MNARPERQLARRATALLSSVALLATGSSLLAPAATADDEATPGPRADLAFTSVSKASLAGQYQIAASDDTGDLFLTSASGRPPVLVATLARVNPQTLEVEAKAELPVLKHGAAGDTFKQLSTHGIHVDDTHDNVWVTNTRDNQVSVYDRESLEYVAGTYDFDAAEAGEITQVAINHPREIIVDEERNRAYVTAASRGSAAEASVTVYDTDVAAGEVITPIHEIAIPARADYPVAGEDAYAVTMGLDIDEATGKVYANDFRTDEYYVIDPADYSLTRHAIPNATVAADGLGSLQPSSIAVDPGAGELYTVNQTQGTTPDSLNVFDLATNELKYSVETGPRALGVDVDRDRGLVYVADFGNGSVTVVDVRNGGEIIEVVQPEGIDAKANHIIVAGGSAYMVDKDGANTDQQVDYALNPATGVLETATVNVDSITKITPAAEAEVVGAAQVPGDITIKGEGWIHPDGSGSTVAVKVDRGAALAPDGTDVWATIEAENNGTFETTINLPEGSLEAGDHTFHLLSGSLKPGDTVRSVTLTATVEAKPADPKPVVKPIKVKKKPVIKGKAVVGKKLRATKPTFNTKNVKLKYQWLRNGKVIKKATKATYKLRKADAKKKIRVRVTATKAGWKKATTKSKVVKVKTKKAAKKNKKNGKKK